MERQQQSQYQCHTTDRARLGLGKTDFSFLLNHETQWAILGQLLLFSLNQSYYGGKISVGRRMPCEASLHAWEQTQDKI